MPTIMYVPNRSHGDRFLCGFADGKVVSIRINHIGIDGGFCDTKNHGFWF